MTKDEAIKTLQELWRETNDSWYEEAYNMAIESLQTDIVRCKDCIYWQSGDMGTGEVYEPYCEMLDTETDESAFCSDGQRRKE